MLYVSCGAHSDSGLTFQCSTIPAGEIRAGFVCALGEVEQHGIWRISGADGFVRKDELAQLTVVGGGSGQNCRVGKAWRLGNEVCIVGRLLDGAVGCAWPE